MLATCGDGTTSEGEWHESMNFAAVHKLPFVMLVENNEWAISTPLDKQMAQPEIWKRAAGYGMPGRRFNGFDPIETYAAVKEAMDRARIGRRTVARSKARATAISRTRPTTTT